MDYRQRSQSPCVGTERADLVMAGCAILEAIRETWPSERLRVADRGLREGILTQMMERDAAWLAPKQGTLAGQWREARRLIRTTRTRENPMSRGKKPTIGASKARPGPGKSGRSGVQSRSLTTKVKTAKGRKLSSTLWLQRQLNDPYVKQAKAEGYASRAAYKIKEMDDRYHILKKGKRVIDLGAAPGGWTQVSVERTGSTPEEVLVVGIDYLNMMHVPGAVVLEKDFLDDDAPDAPDRSAGRPSARYCLV